MRKLKKPHNLNLNTSESLSIFGRGKVWYVLDFGAPAPKPAPLTYGNEVLDWIDGIGDLFKRWWKGT